MAGISKLNGPFYTIIARGIMNYFDSDSIEKTPSHIHPHHLHPHHTYHPHPHHPHHLHPHHLHPYQWALPDLVDTKNVAMKYTK
jgi:hypothetical protein